MLDILRVAVACPTLALGHQLGKLYSVKFRVAAVIGKGPGDIAAAEVVALQSEGDSLHIRGAFCPGFGEAVRQILNPHIDRIRPVGDTAGRFWVFRIKAAL